MSLLSKRSIFSPFAQFAQDESENEQSSDNGSISNSDVEPEMQDFESESRNCVAEIVDHVVPEDQFKSIVSRECSLTTTSEHIQTIDDAFHLFIDDEIINTIIFHTNKKATECMPCNKQWTPVDHVEIDAFLGLLLLMGRHRESRESKHDLWKTTSALCRQFYAAVMSRDRFTQILRCICFDDPRTREERKAEDKLAPLRDITNTFAKNCRECYDATNTFYVNEQLVKFRGRCSFKVYMPNKQGKTLCETNIDKRATQFESQELGLHKDIINAIEATGRKIVKQTKAAGQKRARCCFCVGNDNKYATICDYCNRHVCSAHSTQQRQILCNVCKNT